MSRVKISEEQLKRVISESVANILSELDWRTYQSAADKAYKLADKLTNGYEARRREAQRNGFQKAAHTAFSRQYDLEDFDKNELLPRAERKTPSQGELKRASKRFDDMQNFYQKNQIYKDGNWENK